MPFNKNFNFIWLMEQPNPEEEDMARLGYEVKLQVVDELEQIVTDEDQKISIQLPAGKYLDVRVSLQPNQVDVPIPFPPNTSAVDFVLVKADRQQEVVIKFGGATLQAFTLRPGGCSILDVKNLTGILATNANATASEIRVIMALRQ